MKKYLCLFCFLILLIFSASLSAQIRSDFMIDPDTSYSQGHPAVAFDDNGNWHIIYSIYDSTAGSFIKHAIYNSEGDLIRYPHLITEKPYLLWNYQIATNGNHTVVAFDEGLHVGGKAILAQVLTLNGDHAVPHLAIPHIYESTSFNDVSFVTDTTFFVVYLDYKYPLQHQTTNFQTCTTSGKLLGDPIAVNDDTLSFHYICGIATICSNIAAQRIAIIWEDNSTGIFQLYGRLYSPDGNPRNDRFMITAGNNDNSHWWVAADMDSKGDIAVVWSARVDTCWHIYLRSFFADGTPNGAIIKVNQSDDAGYVPLPDISIDHDGKFVVVWDEYNPPFIKILAQRFIKGAIPVGENFMISTNTVSSYQTAPAVLLRNNSIYTAWRDERIPGRKNRKRLIWANILDFDNPTSVSAPNKQQNASNAISIENYPNPFNSQTMITYDLPRNESVNLKIYDILGKEVITLIKEHKPAGIHRIIWNGQNNEGGDVTSGIYFICLNTERMLQVKKVVLVR